MHLECTNEDWERYRSHHNILNKIKRKAKTTYYIEKCDQYENNTRKLGQIINQTLGKQKHKGSVIMHVNVDGVRTYNPKRISNAFGSFYANLGSNLASKISPGL